MRRYRWSQCQDTASKCQHLLLVSELKLAFMPLTVTLLFLQVTGADL